MLMFLSFFPAIKVLFVRLIGTIVETESFEANESFSLFMNPDLVNECCCAVSDFHHSFDAVYVSFGAFRFYLTDVNMACTEPDVAFHPSIIYEIFCSTVIFFFSDVFSFFEPYTSYTLVALNKFPIFVLPVFFQNRIFTEIAI